MSAADELLPAALGDLPDPLDDEFVEILDSFGLDLDDFDLD
jgi:hypothetical protein